MADTVTGFTADRMQEIEDAAIVDANVVADDLIMTRHDASTFNAGNVRGPVGPMNPDGNPAGTIIMGGWETAPTGYLFGGQTIIGGAATYSELADIYPNWVSGGNLVIPDFTGSVPMGSAGSSGLPAGSNSKTLTMLNIPTHVHAGPAHQHNGPSHSHSIPSHGHGASAGTQPDHDHTLPYGLGAPQYYVVRHDAYGTGSGLFRVWSGGTNPGDFGEAQLGWLWTESAQPDGYHGHTITVNGSGTLGTNNDGNGLTGSGGTGNTGAAGQVAPTAVDVTPRNFGIKFAVKY